VIDSEDLEQLAALKEDLFDLQNMVSDRRSTIDILIKRIFAEVDKSVADLANPSPWEEATYKGRNIAGSKETKGGYMGCGPIENHCMQMRDPESWVHSSVGRWFSEYLMDLIGE
jgi:hypothetical protein